MNENLTPVIKDYNNLPPFKGMVIQQFPFIEEDFDAVTNYQLLCKVVEYLKSIYNNDILEQENITSLYNSYLSLLDYVNTYFDALDVQDEINNKLDEMASDGTLTNLIKGYVDPFINAQNVRIDNIDNKVNSVASGSPLVANSINDMTNTERTYVLTTDGYWYYYNGSEWTRGDIYQSMQLGDNVVSFDNLDNILQKTINNKIEVHDYIIKNFVFEQGTFGDGGLNVNSDVRVRIEDWVTFDKDTYFYIPAGGLIRILKDDGTDKTIVINRGYSNNYGFIFKLVYQANCRYRVCYGFNDGSDITISDIDDFYIYNILENDKTCAGTRKLDIPFVKGRIDYDTGLDIDASGTSYQFFKSSLPFKLSENTKFVTISDNILVVFKYDINGNYIGRYNIDKNNIFGDSNYLYRFSFYNASGTFNINDCIYLLDENIKKSISYTETIDISLSNGDFDSNGDDIAATNVVRTKKIPVTNGKTYSIMFPPNYKAKINRKASYMTNRSSGTGYSSVTFSINDCTDFIRIAFQKNDESDFTISDLSINIINQFQIKEISRTDDYTVVVANPNSHFKNNANIITNGTNDQRYLQSLINCLDSAKIKLLDGIFNLTGLYTTTKSGQKSCLFTAEANTFTETPQNRNITIEGFEKGREVSPFESILNVSFNFAIDDNAENSAFLVPRESALMQTEILSATQLEVNGITILSNTYKHSFVSLDATHARSSKISSVCVRMNGTTTGVARLASMPNENAVGIRAGYGSNNGINNYIKNCMCYGCGKGFSVCGEHFILEDNLAHHCKIGFAFGDRVTRGKMEHPNIMIGCSIEGSYRFMLLTKNGVTIPKDYEASDSDNGIYRSTLIVEGLSTEDMWQIPTDELIQGESDRQLTLPILEIVRGAYRGRIEMDNSNQVFETGSGKGFVTIRYAGSKTFIGKGANVESYL